MTAFLADRAAFDPATWDADQEQAARATVVETHAGKVVPSTRPHALEASVRAMFLYDPLATLAASPRRSSPWSRRDDETGRGPRHWRTPRPRERRPAAAGSRRRRSATSGTT